MDEVIRQTLKHLVEQGKRDFVIYPFGHYGRITKDILNNECGIEERYIVDANCSLQGVRSKKLEELENDMQKDNSLVVLVAVSPLGWDTSIQIHRNLVRFADINRIVSLLSWSMFFTPWNHYEKIFCSSKKQKIALLEALSREIYYNKVKGAVAEAGVYKGETAKFINYLFPDRKLYLFDTFEGFDEKDFEEERKQGRHALAYDFSQTSEELVLEKMHFPNQCIIKKGWFPSTTKGIEYETFSLVRLDMDLYEPILSGLEFFYPRMEKGGYIVVHDCRRKNFEGAREALMDFCRKNGLGYFCMTDDLGSAVISISIA